MINSYLELYTILNEKQKCIYLIAMIHPQDAEEEDASILAGLGSKFKRAKLDLFSAPKLSHPIHECRPSPVGGMGFAKIVRSPSFPQHEFFRPGRVFW